MKPSSQNARGAARRLRLAAVGLATVIAAGCASAGALETAEAPPPHPAMPPAQVAEAAPAAPADEYAFMPAGEGREETIRICSGCHELQLVADQRRSRQEWFDTVQFMVDRGAMGSPAELARVTDYLAEQFPDEG